MVKPLSKSKYITYDNGSEFKLHFEDLCKSFNRKWRPTTVKNPQPNAIIERVHGIIGDMMRTSNLDMIETVKDTMIGDFLVNVAWAICSTYHIILKSTPRAAISGRDMLFDIPYVADWNIIGQLRQEQVERINRRENKSCLPYDYAIGDKVLIKKMEFSANQRINMRVLILLHKCITMVPLGYKGAIYQRESILEDWHLTQVDLKLDRHCFGISDDEITDVWMLSSHSRTGFPRG